MRGKYSSAVFWFPDHGDTSTGGGGGGFPCFTLSQGIQGISLAVSGMRIRRRKSLVEKSWMICDKGISFHTHPPIDSLHRTPSTDVLQEAKEEVEGVDGIIETTEFNLSPLFAIFDF